MRGIIGLDLDEVSVGYMSGLRTAAAAALNVDPESLIEPFSYSLYESGWFESEDQFREIHGQAVEDGLYAKLEMLEGASEALWDLSNAGFHIHVITSRFVNHGQNARVLADTANSLDRLRIPYRDISFIKDKRRVLADIYIDDSPSNIKLLREAGRHVLTFDTLYNRSITGPRAYNWTEAKAYIEENFPEVES